jgi:hypothetical protein
MVGRLGWLAGCTTVYCHNLQFSAFFFLFGHAKVGPELRMGSGQREQ